MYRVVNGYLEYYAKSTRKDGKAKNKVFEQKKASAFQMQWLKNYDKKNAGNGATIRGIVYSYKPQLHDAVGAVVLLRNKKTGKTIGKAIADKTFQGAPFHGHTSCYEFTKVPPADSASYALTASYKNPQTGKLENSRESILLGEDVKTGSTRTADLHLGQ